MRVGTPLRLKFHIDLENFAYDRVERAELTMRQSYTNVIIRNLVIEEDCFWIDLTQEDMYLFKPEKVRIQIKMVYPDGEVISTCIVDRVIKGLLNYEVLTNMDVQRIIKKDADPINMHIEEQFITGEGTKDYTKLVNKPTINGTSLEGDVTLKDLGIVVPVGVTNENLIFS